MKPLLTLSILLFCLHLQSQDLASFKMPDQYIEVPPAPDYFHKTMVTASEPDFKLAGKYLDKGATQLLLATLIGVVGSTLTVLTAEEQPEISRGIAIGTGALAVILTIGGTTKIKRAGKILREY